MLRPMKCLLRNRRRALVILAVITFFIYYMSIAHVTKKPTGNVKTNRHGFFEALFHAIIGDPWKTLPRLKADSGNTSAVLEMTRFAWQGYLHLCALSQNGNELAPVTNSCSPIFDSVVGPNNLLTVIDSLDTLLLMGLNKEFNEGRELTKKMFDPMLKNSGVSVFEVTIRILGGLLGAFSLTEDSMFTQMASQVANGLSAVFRDGSFAKEVKMVSEKLKKEGPEKEDKKEFVKSETNTAEVGSLYLDFAYVADITDNQRLLAGVNRYQKALLNVTNLDGVLPLRLSANSPWKLEGVFGTSYSAGGMGDSYYEYLVKRCLFDVPVESDCIVVFSRALDGIIKHLTAVTPTKHVCITEIKAGEQKLCRMEHLSCFAGGMFALGYLQNRSRTDWLEYAESVTKTCYLSYLHSPTGLGPESFEFNDSSQKFTAKQDFYILRPETIESIFYLYRVTGNQMYRDWGWNIMKALNSTPRTASGFSGVKSMNSKPTLDNNQWSFFLAETLKYMYLLFSSSETLPIDQWVFNTEAHVIPSNRNPMRLRYTKRKTVSLWKGILNKIGF